MKNIREFITESGMTEKKMIDTIIKEIKPVYDKWRDEYFDYLIARKELKRNDYKEYERTWVRSEHNILLSNDKGMKEKLVIIFDKKLVDVSKAIHKKIVNAKIGKVFKIERVKDSHNDLDFYINDAFKLSIRTIVANGYVQVTHYRVITTITKINMEK